MKKTKTGRQGLKTEGKKTVRNKNFFFQLNSETRKVLRVPVHVGTSEGAAGLVSIVPCRVFFVETKVQRR